MNKFKVLPKKPLCGGTNPRNLISFYSVCLPYTDLDDWLTGAISNG